MKKYLILFILSSIASLVCYSILNYLPDETYHLFKIRTDKGHEIIYLVDLNNDGYKEQIEKKTLLNTATLYFKAGNNTLEYQHNFKSNWVENSNFFFGDYNHNNLVEAYGFHFENDSLFLSGVEYPKKVVLNRHFIVKGFSDLTSSNLNGGIFFTNEDSANPGKIILSVMGGYGARPRNLFLLDIDTGSLISTPDSIKSYLDYFDSFDINGDNRNEVIAWGRAPDNNHGSEYFSDQDSYLMAFDDQLILMDWHKNPGIGSFTFFWKHNKDGFIVMNAIDTVAKSKVFRYSNKGKLNLLNNPEVKFHISYPPFLRNKEVYFGTISEGLIKTFHKLTEDFQLKESFQLSDRYIPLLSPNFRFLSTDHFFTLNTENQKVYVSKAFEDTKTDLGQLLTENALSISEGNFRDKKIIAISTKGFSRFWEIRNSSWNRYKTVFTAISFLLTFVIGFLISIQKKISLESEERPDQILRINTRTGFEIIPYEQILYCKADGKYTIVETVDNGSVLSSTNLGSIEPKMVSTDFIRLGRSIIVNKKYLRKVDRKKLKAYFKVEGGIKELDLTIQEIKGLNNVFD